MAVNRSAIRFHATAGVQSCGREQGKTPDKRLELTYVDVRATGSSGVLTYAGCGGCLRPGLWSVEEQGRIGNKGFEWFFDDNVAAMNIMASTILS